MNKKQIKKGLKVLKMAKQEYSRINKAYQKELVKVLRAEGLLIDKDMKYFAFPIDNIIDMEMDVFNRIIRISY